MYFFITSMGSLFWKPVIQKVPNYRKTISHRLHYKQIILILIFKNDLIPTKILLILIVGKTLGLFNI
ncbi:hypothetical protein XENTR_v10024230 [Xenopus tropicalis]|nr:hypothetical protein XENTR_v10024230 [Xenopus tropicalis]